MSEFREPYEKCGPDCVATPPVLDTADGREHDDCPEVPGLTDSDIILGDYRDYLPAKDGCWVVTDPPYNVGFSYPEYQDRLQDNDYRDLFAPLAGYRSVIINYPEVMLGSIVPVLGAPRRMVAWCYNSNLSRQWRMIAWFGCEPQLSLVKQPYKNLGDARVMELIKNGSEGCALYDWWQVEMVKNVSAEKRGYVNQIPEEIISRILLTTVPPGELVFDPFCGSGTTSAVARRLGFPSIATDISEVAISIALERLSELRLFA